MMLDQFLFEGHLQNQNLQLAAQNCNLQLTTMYLDFEDISNNNNKTM